ncbi:BQ5605_C001g00109 [Microbotryum silenes-dioicae]|uniref:BQ5605_C001g00109 protein n=1 Tax=Microbotryum silenes-dioicae TaxID=796604 RepID=A0A2X0M5U6_9BASI|nr:BQ5605_C001g00109 [Microbotryum silenes-dioicae]
MNMVVTLQKMKNNSLPWLSKSKLAEPSLRGSKEFRRFGSEEGSGENVTSATELWSEATAKAGD